MIGIIGAMDIEVDLIEKNFKNSHIEKVGPYEFILGELNNKSCVLCKCSIGKVNAAACTQTMILKYKPSFIINTGIAGSIVDNINIFDFVIATSVVQHDVDTTHFGDPLGFITDLGTVNIPCSNYLIDKVFEVNTDFTLHKGIIASGDQFISDLQTIEKIKKNFNAYACEMEGASIGQVCYINKTDFLIVRAISDNANSTTVVDYNEFKRTAAHNCAKLVIDLIKAV